MWGVRWGPGRSGKKLRWRPTWLCIPRSREPSEFRRGTRRAEAARAGFTENSSLELWRSMYVTRRRGHPGRGKWAAGWFVRGGVQFGLVRISWGLKRGCHCTKVYLTECYVLRTHHKCGILSLRAIFEFKYVDLKKQMDTLPYKTRAWKYLGYEAQSGYVCVCEKQNIIFLLLCLIRNKIACTFLMS